MTVDPVLRYYDGPDLTETVFGALRAAGRPVEELDPDDLAALDEFHALGRPATLALADLAAIARGERVLDVGAGLGGPARVLARRYGADVTALDPTERFCRLDAEICARAAGDLTVTVVRGDARALPFPDGSFDVVWTQAVLQGLADKARVAAELARVLRPGGRYALFEIVAGPGGELVFPVPWADGPPESFVVEEAQLRETLTAAGFTVTAWRTMPEIGEGVRAAAAGPGMSAGRPGVTLELVLPDVTARMAGLARNVQEARIGLVQAVLTVG